MRSVVSGAVSVILVAVIVLGLVWVTKSSQEPEKLTIQPSVAVFAIAQGTTANENLELLLVLERVQIGQEVTLLNSESKLISAFFVGSTDNNIFVYKVSFNKEDFSGITFYLDDKPIEYLPYLLVEVSDKDFLIDSITKEAGTYFPGFGYVTAASEVEEGIWDLYSVGQNCAAAHYQQPFRLLPMVQVSCEYTILISPDKQAHSVNAVKSVE